MPIVTRTRASAVRCVNCQEQLDSVSIGNGHFLCHGYTKSIKAKLDSVFLMSSSLRCVLNLTKIGCGTASLHIREVVGYRDFSFYLFYMFLGFANRSFEHAKMVSAMTSHLLVYCLLLIKLCLTLLVNLSIVSTQFCHLSEALSTICLSEVMNIFQTSEPAYIKNIFFCVIHIKFTRF
jgi:hypothetical protein